MLPQWILPAYIISGITMAIGGYFSYKYKPYCMFESPEREEAMELRRKKLREKELGVKNEMTNEEEKRYTILMRTHYEKSFLRDKVFFFSGFANIYLLFILIVPTQKPINYSLAFLIVAYSISRLHGLIETSLFCVSYMKYVELAILESHHKQMHGYQLDKEDERNIKNTRLEITMYIWQRRILYIGLCLYLLASLMYLLFLIIKKIGL